MYDGPQSLRLQSNVFCPICGLIFLIGFILQFEHLGLLSSLFQPLLDLIFLPHHVPLNDIHCMGDVLAAGLQDFLNIFFVGLLRELNAELHFLFLLRKLRFCGGRLSLRRFCGFLLLVWPRLLRFGLLCLH